MQKVTIGFVTIVVALGLRFGSLRPVEPIIQSQTQIERQLSSTQPYQAMEGSKSPSVSNLLKLSGGDLGKASNPGARARNDGRKAITNRPKAAKSKPAGSSFAEAWTTNHSKRSRPAAANRLAQQFQTGPAEGGNGLFGRFSARPTPDPRNPGCAGGPRSITVLSQSKSNQCPANKTQAASFVKNGVVDLHEAYQEVLRRAAKLGAENFDCSFQRFKELSTEYREPTEVGVREAITGLQGEMLGYYKNLVRGHYGKGVSGPDFKVKGIGKYRHITHIEIKNPVGKAIEEASRGFSNLHKQGENAALKIQNQQKKWSNTTFIENQRHWNASESFPKTPANMLGIVDLFDVPFGEKPIIENSIKNNVQIGSPVIIINNQETGNV